MGHAFKKCYKSTILAYIIAKFHDIYNVGKQLLKKLLFAIKNAFAVVKTKN